ncbi:hypothetical protein U9M48_030844 [Paspalum notatum var. saurae]|uniref:Uncharacterized protein n=1 Tax=Paspalum notatum var. saurae TaxID=547442 RepID=A0AAQ3U3R6_PASNO
MRPGDARALFAAGRVRVQGLAHCACCGFGRIALRQAGRAGILRRRGHEVDKPCHGTTRGPSAPWCSSSSCPSLCILEDLHP